MNINTPSGIQFVQMNKNKQENAAEYLIITSDDAFQECVSTWCAVNHPSIWYFSVDYILYRKLKAHWDDVASFVPVGDLLNQIALGAKDEFTNFDECIASGRGSDLDWYASNVGERSPYASTYLLSTTRLLALQDSFAKGGKHIVIVDDVPFGYAVYKTVLAAGQKPIWRQPENHFGSWSASMANLTDALRSTWRGLIARARGVAGEILRKRKVARVRSESPVRLSELVKVDILIVIWAKSGSFPVQGEIKEVPFLGALPETLRNEGYNIGFVVVPLHYIGNYADIVKRATQTDSPVLIFEETFSYLDLLTAAWHSLFQGRAINNIAKVLGKKISPAVQYEKRIEWRDWRPGRARLFSALGPYFKRHSLKPKVIIHSYENHSWEKCLRAGIRKHLPEARILGCQQSPFSPLYLNYIPTSTDIQKGNVLDGLLVSGMSIKDSISVSGYSPDNIYNIGSYRFREFLDQTLNRDFQESDRGTVNIVCATGPDVDECIELVCKVVEASVGLSAVNVLANFHPLVDEEHKNKIRCATSSLGSDFPDVEFRDESIQELLNQADIVCYSDTNCVFEAMSKDIQVVHIQRISALDYDKAPSTVSVSARSVEELSVLFARFAQGKRLGADATTIKKAIDSCLDVMNHENVIRAVQNRPPV